MLIRAKEHADAVQLDEAWSLLHDSIGMRIYGVSSVELDGIAESLIQEGNAKLSGWRKEAVSALIHPSSRTRTSLPPNTSRRWLAERIRDESYRNMYRKLSTLRLVIRILPWVLALAPIVLAAIVWHCVFSATVGDYSP